MSDSPTPPPSPSPSPSPANNALSFLKFEDAPPFGGGTMPVDKEKTFVLLAHIFSWIIWLWKRNESPAVNAHGKEATNFFLTYVICVIPVQIIAGFVPVIGMIIAILLSLLGLAYLALAIFAGIKAQEGKLLRYPVNFRLIK